MFLFFFFFQAEDGIRDGHVTGVQTCALPISGGSGCGVVRLRAERGGSLICLVRHVALRGSAGTTGGRRPCAPAQGYMINPSQSRDKVAIRSCQRSEERRVGKEVGSRWSAYQK